MIRYEAIGVIETQYFAVAAEILDIVCKGANVEYLCSEKYLGGRLVSLIVGGSISEVKAAIDIAGQVAHSKPGNPLKMALAITMPHEEIMNYILPALKEEPHAPEEIKDEREPEVEMENETALKLPDDGTGYADSSVAGIQTPEHEEAGQKKDLANKNTEEES